MSGSSRLLTLCHLLFDPRDEFKKNFLRAHQSYIRNSYPKFCDFKTTNLGCMLFVRILLGRGNPTSEQRLLPPRTFYITFLFGLYCTMTYSLWLDRTPLGSMRIWGLYISSIFIRPELPICIFFTNKKINIRDKYYCTHGQLIFITFFFNMFFMRLYEGCGDLSDIIG